MSLPGTSVEEALATLLGQFRCPDPVQMPAEDTEGLILARPLVSREIHPPHDTSAMDGYAVRADCLRAASIDTPITLELVEDIRAGFPPKESIASGYASRISTGALVPDGADAVVMREDVTTSEGRVTFSAPARQAQNIRFAGEHVKVGDEVVPSGRVVGPAALGMAAYLGIESFWVYPPISVSVLATGSELVKSGESLAKGQIRDSNSVSLASAVRRAGGNVVLQKSVPDSPEALDEALEEAFAASRVVLTSGGISAGWHDLVRQRIERLGGVFDFHKLRMRPGKPLAFGHCGDAHFFCLPGNPVSSMVTFEIFVKPALKKLLGREPQERVQTAKLKHDVRKKKGFCIFFRGILTESDEGERLVEFTGPQGSHMLRSLVEANVLIRTKEKDEFLPAGSLVDVVPYFD